MERLATFLTVHAVLEIVLIGGAVLGLVTATFARRWRGASGLNAFSGVAVAAAWWSFTQALQMRTIDPGQRLWLAGFQSLGSVSIIPLWLIFALRLTHRDHQISRRSLAALWIVPLLVILQVWIVATSQGVRLSTDLRIGNPVSILSWVWQLAWNIYVIVFYALGATAIIQSSSNIPRVYRQQTTLLVLATLLPPASVALLLGPANTSLASLAFVLFCVLASASLNRLAQLDLAPITSNAAMENMLDGMLTLDLHDRIINANPAAASLLQRPVEALIGQSLLASLSGWAGLPDPAPAPDGLPLNYHLSSASGQEIELRLTSIHDDYGSLVGRLGELRDTTETRQKNEQLHLFSAALEAAANGIVLTGTDGTIIWVNPAFTRITGYSLEEAVGQRPSLLKSGRHDERFYRNLWETILAGKSWRGQIINRHRDGSLYYEEMTISPVWNEAGQISHFVAIKQDINERKRTEEALARFNAEKHLLLETEAVSQERSRIAQEIHDGLAQNLAALRIRIQRWHRLIDNEPARMHAELDELQQVLTESLLEVRRSIFALRPLPLASLGFFPALHQFLTGFSEYYPVKVELQVNGPPERLPTRLEIPVFRIIQEALNNCARHANAQHAWILIDLEQAGYLRVNIRDDGKGMDTTDLAQAERRGHYGLQTIRERTEKFRGTLQIQGQPGQGVEISIVLPVEGP